MSRASKRAPRVQPGRKIGRPFPYLYHASAFGWTGRTCVYCKNDITWDELTKENKVQTHLPQSPRLVGSRHVDAHVWCRLKAILGPKRARAHRPSKRKKA